MVDRCHMYKNLKNMPRIKRPDIDGYILSNPICMNFPESGNLKRNRNRGSQRRNGRGASFWHTENLLGLHFIDILPACCLLNAIKLSTSNLFIFGLLT